ncbi:hypothetical protein HanXRQr2_Chr13g0584741 [Helianthus annuus]|uniref:Uncharacterized protein n=1 Tax=Helianthus annuus TaxID=4232 RepID=A0A9K3EH52_HELAN|nr:hypothetical protein HanXRQr2_Chr13g0584741 [Helianthus annuus]KAJ0848918.1 hypothetical protein HanPSC8_Chr13g0563001 [Helianthus annuus]
MFFLENDFDITSQNNPSTTHLFHQSSPDSYHHLSTENGHHNCICVRRTTTLRRL